MHRLGYQDARRARRCDRQFMLARSRLLHMLRTGCPHRLHLGSSLYYSPRDMAVHSFVVCVLSCTEFAQTVLSSMR